MSRFDDQINRMRELCTYGRIDEDEKIVNRSIEHKETAADGVTYGIIRECSKFYIESCPKGKENLVEAYDYLGGFNNKKDYEYTSYPMALKQFKLKMDSINEAVHAETDTTEIVEAPNQQLMTEGGKKMQAEIARMQQIMRNAAIIMNESSEKMTGVVGSSKSADKNTPFTETVSACENGGECGGETASEPKKQSKPFDQTVTAKVNEGKCCNESEDEDEEEIEDEAPEITDEPMGDEPVGGEDVVDDEVPEMDSEEDAEEGDFELDGEDDEEDEDEEEDDEDEFDIDDEDGDFEEDEFDFEGDEDEFDFGGDEEGEDFDFEDEEEIAPLSENRRKRLDRIVESMINTYKRGNMLNETELHDFGKHPGYRKRSFTLPPTGEDSNAHGADINDDSVHNEMPFGQAKGDSTPFSILVDKVTSEVKKALAESNNITNRVHADVKKKIMESQRMTTALTEAVAKDVKATLMNAKKKVK